MKSKTIFITDLILVPLFILTFYTGLELHIAGHGTNHSVWHDWAVLHTIVGILFTLAGVLHVKAHWGWYKGIKNRGLKNKSKTTLGLSGTFIAVVVSGFLLLFCIEGMNTPVGFLHTIIGIMASIWGILHIFKRFPMLQKGVRLTFIKKTYIWGAYQPDKTMKKTNFYKTACASGLALVATAVCGGSASAQVSAFAQGFGSRSIEGYTLPRTVVTATLVIEREVILRGPYAKFAAQYLGISGAAMSDKQNCRIIDAALGYYEEPDPAQTYHLDQSVDQQSKAFHWLSVTPPPRPLLADADYPGAAMGNNNPFTDVSLHPLYGTTTSQSGLADGASFGELSVNRTSSVEKSTEQMASEAATAIYTLRKRRFDLVTGETGENVFGAGLPAAIQEMDRLEAEYLALFIGKRYTQRVVKTFSVLPQAGKGTTIACRFSPTKGVVPDTDLSGRPIVIEMTAEAGAATGGSSANAGGVKKGAVSVRYRVPSVQVVKLVDGNDELARERIPVFQMGSVTSAPVVF